MTTLHGALFVIVATTVLYGIYTLAHIFNNSSIDPLMDHVENHVNYNPSPLNLAAIDFSLRLLEVVGRERTNVVFSPDVIAENLHLTYKASHNQTATQIEQMVIDPRRFKEVNVEDWFSGYSGLHSGVPCAGLIEEDSSIFGVKRSWSLAPEAEHRLDAWFERFMGISEGQIEERKQNKNSAFGYEMDTDWIKQNFTQHTRLGNMQWHVAYSRGDLLNLATEVYCQYSWAIGELREGGESVGLAPFRVNGETKMVPTVCVRKEHAAIVNDDRNVTAIRMSLRTIRDQVFWIVARKGESTDGQNGVKFSVEDMEHWRHYDMRFLYGPRGQPGDSTTRWKGIQHVHFPCFSFSSSIDLSRAFREMGADRVFDPRYADTFKPVGENAYVDRFESSLSIAVDEDGIGPAHTGDPVTQPLNCANPDLIVDHAFDFFLMDGHSVLLLGSVADPTVP